MFVLRTTKKRPSFLSRLILAVAASVAIQGCGDSANEYVFTGNVPLTPPAQTRHLAVYIIGSNLESGDGAATADLNEMVTGLRTLSAEQRQSLDLLIAFGGADKAGWRGVKWMNQQQLLQDSEDGVYGNETAPDSYLLVDGNADMGAPATLTRFLDRTGQTSSTDASRFVVLWDHGGAYRGYGPDEVTNKAMDLGELGSAFENSTLPKLDMIGFDACLMASLEVGKTMAPHGHKLIASEELEPGHGWDYRYVVPAFVTADNIDTYAVGLVDNYVDSANHPFVAMGKSLSVVNLDAYGQLETALTAYSDAYSGELLPVGPTATGFVRAATQAQPFYSFGDDERVTIDLVDFVNKSLFFNGREAGDETALLAAIQNYVIYANDDGTFAEAAGVSIIPPDLSGQRLTQPFYAGVGWFDLVQSSIALIGSDVTPPQLTDLAVTADGIVASFADPLLVRVDALYGLETADGNLRVLNSDRATLVGNSNSWTIDPWEGETVHLNYASGAAPYPLTLTFAREFTYEGEQIYMFYADISIREAGDPEQTLESGRIALYVDEDGLVLDHDLAVTTTDADGNETVKKVEDGLTVGDIVSAKAYEYPVGSQSAEAQIEVDGPELVISQTPTFTTHLVVPPAGTRLVYAIAGKDFARNRTISDLQPLVP